MHAVQKCPRCAARKAFGVRRIFSYAATTKGRSATKQMSAFQRHVLELHEAFHLSQNLFVGEMTRNNR